MKRFVKYIIPLLLLTIAFGFAYYEDSFKIIGPPEFKTDVEEALALLEEKAPDYHELVKTYLRSVTYSKEGWNPSVDSLRNFYFPEGAYNNRKKSEFKTFGIAFDLVHEATHAKRIKLGLDNPNNVEGEERIAVEAEIEVAKILEAPQGLIDWLEEKKYDKWWEQQGE